MSDNDCRFLLRKALTERDAARAELAEMERRWAHAVKCNFTLTDRLGAVIALCDNADDEDKTDQMHSRFPNPMYWDYVRTSHVRAAATGDTK